MSQPDKRVQPPAPRGFTKDRAKSVVADYVNGKANIAFTLVYDIQYDWEIGYFFPVLMVVDNEQKFYYITPPNVLHLDEPPGWD